MPDGQLVMISSGTCEKNSTDVDIFNSRRKMFKGERGLITGQNGITYLLHRIRKDRIQDDKLGTFLTDPVFHSNLFLLIVVHQLCVT